MRTPFRFGNLDSRLLDEGLLGSEINSKGIRRVCEIPAVLSSMEELIGLSRIDLSCPIGIDLLLFSGEDRFLFVSRGLACAPKLEGLLGGPEGP